MFLRVSLRRICPEAFITDPSFPTYRNYEFVVSDECDNLFLLGGIKMVRSTSSRFWFSPYTGMITMKCSFKGWPRPRVVWYNPDGKLITDGSEGFYLYERHNGEDTVTSGLYIFNIQEKDSGVYKCKAMNNITGWSSTLSEDIELIYKCK